MYNIYNKLIKYIHIFIQIKKAEKLEIKYQKRKQK